MSARGATTIVVKSSILKGLLGPRPGQWWQLGLQCGHVVHRPVYGPTAPRRVRCEHCKRD